MISDLKIEFNEIFNDFCNSKYFIKQMDLELLHRCKNPESTINSNFNVFLDIRKKKQTVLTQYNVFKNCLNKLSEFERDFIKEYYINNKTIFYCAEKFNKSVRTLFRYQDKIASKVLTDYHKSLEILNMKHKPLVEILYIKG